MFLGIDVGTSGVKAVILSSSGDLLAEASSSLTVSRLHSSWSEQNPDDWWTATQDAILQLDPSLRAQILAIGLAGQMHGATLLGNDDRPLHPAILWNDGRSFAECAALELAEPASRSITGNLAMPGFTAPKLLWIRQHEPAIFDQIATVLLPKDYVRLCMTGDKASDMSDSAGTLWLDVAGRRWSDPMLAATGLQMAQMPKLLEGCEISGQLRQDIAAAWGMNTVPVVAGGGDNAAGAVGVGVIEDGDAFLSLGTSGVIFVATGQYRPNPAGGVHTFCHCLPETWHQMSVHLSAASCVDWGARLTGLPGLGEFFAAAQAAGSATGPEIFLPYLSGERTPHNDPHIRGTFLSLGNETDPGALAVSILEGVAFAHADGLDALRNAGTAIEQLTVIGGGARSQFWGTILSAVLGVRLVYIDGGEVGPALGAAKLAQIAMTGESAAQNRARPAIRDIIEPDPLLAERLAPKLARFRDAFAKIKAIQE